MAGVACLWYLAVLQRQYLGIELGLSCGAEAGAIIGAWCHGLQSVQQESTQMADSSLIHSVLKDSLAQARGEGLVSDDDLETGDVDVRGTPPRSGLVFPSPS